MAITATTGSAASTTVAAASLALPSFNLTAGQDVYVAIALGSTSSSVTSITDTKGNVYSIVLANNGTSVRSELWKSRGVAAQTTNVITINVSPNCNIAGAAEEYAGVSNIGNTGNDSATSNVYPRGQVVTQDGNNWIIMAHSHVCASGDTNTASLGTKRQFSIPAATAVGVALFDNTSVGIVTLRTMGVLNNARNWASVGVELRSGGSAISYADYATITAPSLQTAKDFRVKNVNMPNVYPNTPLSIGGSYGYVS